MAEKLARRNKTRAQAARYGIAEWFGKDIGFLTPENRQAFGHIAARQDQEKSLAGAPECPFLSTLIPGARCNKSGGVCSIRKYDAEGSAVTGDKVVTMCPSRFLQPLRSGETLFAWIAEKMLDTPNVMAIKETPFLRKIAGVRRQDETGDEAEEEEKQAGRIDWILVKPETISAGELEWCAVETQALYFSGARMRPEFDSYAHAPSGILFPTGKRRPDYRSSGPKRLWPQLDVKVPVLRSWGKKIVVVVDRYFYNNMHRLADPSPRARDDKERRENADVAWFVVDYDEHLRLVGTEIIFTTLDGSRIALNATEPLSKANFTECLKRVIADESRTKKFFKL